MSLSFKNFNLVNSKLIFSSKILSIIKVTLLELAKTYYGVDI